MNRKRLTTGLVGTGVTLLCCFTPVLFVIFGVIGLSAIAGWIPYVVMPLLGFFILLTIYALVERNKQETSS